MKMSSTPALPFIEVTRLPSSTSFYSAVTQPLGLRYISVKDHSSGGSPPSPSITYGYGIGTSSPKPVFELRQVQPGARRPLKLSRLVFSAASPAVVREFQAAVRRIKEEDRQAQTSNQALIQGSLIGSEAGISYAGAPDRKQSAKAAETDLDGNMLEVVYVPPPEYQGRYAGSNPTTRKTQSTQSEVGRILDWNYDVASSDSARAMSLAPLAPASSSLVSARRPGRFPDDGPYPALRRSVATTTTTVYPPTEPTTSPRQTSNGLMNTGTVVGALIGVAAAGAAIGASITYGAMRNERVPNASQDFETPLSSRRSTFPEPFPDKRGRYPEHARSVKEFPRSDEHTAVTDRRPPPTILTRYTQEPLAARDDMYDDGRSRYSSRFRPSGASSIRTRSEVATSRKPLLLMDAEYRSYTGSKHSAKTSEVEDMARGHRSHASSRHSSSRSKHTPSVPRSNTFDVADGDSYVSARSHRTASTVRAPSTPTTQTELVSRPASKAPKASSRISASTLKGPEAPRRADSYVSGRDVPLPASRAASYVSAREIPLPQSRRGTGTSYVSARHVPLPASGVGSSHADWDDDLDSIAPSDSISCVGSRRSERLHH